jgi:hypothetical protein
VKAIATRSKKKIKSQVVRSWSSKIDWTRFKKSPKVDKRLSRNVQQQFNKIFCKNRTKNCKEILANGPLPPFNFFYLSELLLNIIILLTYV